MTPQEAGIKHYYCNQPSVIAALQMIAEIVASVNDGEYAQYGLRYLGPGQWQVGDILDPSRVWDDNNPTDYLCDGASACRINQFDRCCDTDDVINAIRAMGAYENGGPIALVGGNTGQCGEDAGEVVIRNAEIVMLFGSNAK